LFYEFSKEVSDGMAPAFPTLEQGGEIPIKLAGLLTWFAFKKRGSLQPALHRPDAYSDLPGNGLRTLALLGPRDHLLIVSQPLLTPGLLETQKRRGGSDRSFGLPNRCHFIVRGLYVTCALSRQMMRQKSLQGLSEIFEEVKSICTLKSSVSCFLSSPINLSRS
jgi:hypothetical protein